MELLKVQKNTIDEIEIAFELKGNRESKNLFVMVHGGGMDHREKGAYVGLCNGIPGRYLGKDNKEHTMLYQAHIGTYDRMAGLIEAEELDTQILSIDLRNHGESGKDNRDTSVERNARDLSDIIDYMVNKYDINNINLMGTCFGGLVCQTYLLGIGKNKTSPMLNNQLVKSLILNCSLSNLNLYTNNPLDKYNYKISKKILEDNNYKYTRMKGIVQGIETITEAKKNGDISQLLANKNIPILFIYAMSDRLIYPNISSSIASNLAKNALTEIIKVTNYDHGFADHCLYDPASNDLLVKQSTRFLSQQLEKQKEIIKKK